METSTLGLLGGTGSGNGPGGPSANLPKDASMADHHKNEADLELGLGLSLVSGGGGVVGKCKGSAWGEYGRILTAKDFPNGYSSRANGVSGTKRGADCVGSTEVGSPSSGVSQVIGWPPVKTYRMNSLINQLKVSSAEEEKGVGGNEKENSKKKINHGTKNDAANKAKGHLGFVKVNMDGLPIGRKVDLNSHTCYETLANLLEEMFFKSSSKIKLIRHDKEQAALPSRLLDGSSEFVLTYEDKEGDWMLVGDVPWGMFLSTVKRLRIMRTSEANGLGSKTS